MFDWTDFDAVFQQNPNFSYDTKTVEQIRKRRREFDGKLFVDRILESIGLKNVTKLYPPPTNQDLRSLFQKIIKTSAAPHHKHALLFYMLKDASRTLSNLDQNFARQTYLPSKYITLITGLWYLDHSHLSSAVDCLTDPSLTPTFTDEILSTLLKHEKPSDGLAMSYYISVSPPLASLDLKKSYFALLAASSVTQAYIFTQSQPLDVRQTLFEDLVITTLSGAADETRAAKSMELIALPLAPEEDACFEQCLLYGKGSQCANAKDTVIARRIAMGRDPSGPGALDRTRGPKIGGRNWDDFRVSLGKV